MTVFPLRLNVETPYRSGGIVPPGSAKQAFLHHLSGPSARVTGNAHGESPAPAHPPQPWSATRNETDLTQEGGSRGWSGGASVAELGTTDPGAGVASGVQRRHARRSLTAKPPWSERATRASPRSHPLGSSLLLLLALPGFLGAGGTGTSTANFLKLGVGGRAVAMGEAQVALSNDVLSTYWNPAGLGRLRTPEAAFMHHESVQDTRYEYLAYAHPLPLGGTLAGSLSLLTIRDLPGFDLQDRSTGELRANDLLGSLGWGQHWDTPEVWWQGLGLGATLKFLRKTLDQNTASTVMTDLGAQYELPRTPLEGLTVGMALQHVGPGLKFVQERSPLPRTLRVGLGYERLFNKQLSLALDAVKPRDRGVSLHLGGEYRVAGLLAFRVGYRTQDDLSSGLSYGLGLGPDRLHVDYALVPFGELGLTHRVSILARFGAPRATTQRAERAFQRGLHLLEQGLYAEAILELNRVLERDPQNAEALQLMLKANDHLEAVLSPTLVSPPVTTTEPAAGPPELSK